MAIEQNPFEQINPAQDNVIPMPTIDESSATFEVDSEGGVLVDFNEEVSEAEMGPEESVEEWYRNLRDDLDEGDLQDIGSTLYDNYESDSINNGCTAVQAPWKGSDVSSILRPSKSKPRSNIDSHSLLDDLSDS